MLLIPSRVLCVFLFLCLLVLIASPSLADDPKSVRPDNDPLFGSPIADLIEPYWEAKQWAADEIRIDATLYYTWWWQAATEVQAGESHFLYGRTDLGARWHLLEMDDNGFLNDGSLKVWMRNGAWYDAPDGEDLGPNVGTYPFTTDAGYSQHVSLNLLYWEQWFVDSTFAVVIGKVHPNAFVTLQPAANDESTQFFSAYFDGNNNPILGGYNPGMALLWQPVDWFHVHTVVVDTADDVGTFVEYIGNGRWGLTGEVAFTPTIPGMGQGSYGVAWWYANMQGAPAPGPIGGEGLGVVFSMNQFVYDGVNVFFEYGYGNPKTTAQEQLIKGGVGFTKPFGRKGDMFGLAAAWAKPSRDTLREETFVEMFYRIQVTEMIQFTPDIQFVMNPALNNSNDFAAIFGLRLRVAF